MEDILDDPSRIFNGDESGFSMCPKSGKVIAPKGFKNVYEIKMASEKETITVLEVICANGEMLPMVIFPYLRPPRDIINSMPENWILGRSESGWMRSETFFEYVGNGFHNYLNIKNIKRPVILFIDGHKSHLTMELIEFCNEHQIVLYALPPNTTHIMQPADKRLKTSENLAQTIRNGFRKSGLFPFNPNALDYSKYVSTNLKNLQENDVYEDNELRTEKFKIASEVILNLESQLRDRGLDPNAILDVIDTAKRGVETQSIVIPNILSTPGAQKRF
ncbi:PREDICTED: uncharacterized protein LOC108371207 [Rhagoletis zephyria]|uniref:uncharacterized protein LOC108371207 n=1 Tax=Rhagoletis zephyria TaxID=28612 RepID=UPI000811A705|nr:PREDICTED: uncharacterized protein LOC108371207 [Rhagoletis zephyria]